MDFNAVVVGRRSIRKFEDRDIPNDVIMKMLKLAAQAPSAGNRQMWGFIIVKSAEMKQQMRKAVEDGIDELVQKAGPLERSMEGPKRAAAWFAEAPVVIAVTTQVYRSPLDNLLSRAGYSEPEIDELRCRPDLQSIGAVVQNLLLAAHNEGFGTCWLTGPMVARGALEKLLNVEPPHTLAALVTLGVPRQTPVAKEIKPLEDVVRFI